MSIELKQVITQIIAFLIVLWILKRYAWRPLLSILDERTRKIQALFKEAEQKNSEAEAQKAIYNKKLSEIHVEGRALIQNAAREAKQIADTIESRAQLKAHEIISRSQEQAARDLLKAKVELKKDLVDLYFHAIEKIVKVKLSKEDKDRVAYEMLESYKP